MKYLAATVKRLMSSGSVLTKMGIDGILIKETVRINDKDLVASKLKRLIGDGAQRLQIISDFDHTMSKSTSLLTHDIFISGMNEVQKTKINNLTEKYMPIERHSTMTSDEKTPHMVDWWTQSHDIIMQLGFQKKALATFIQDSNLELRDKCVEFFRCSQDAGIPVSVFSAGIGDAIEILLTSQLCKLSSNLHIISNFMEFDDKEKIVGFRSPLIHAFNKTSAVVRGDRFFCEELQSRPNVLLLGDSLGDLNMDAGVTNEAVCLKIGYFNCEVTDAALKPYLSGYDIVLIGDQTFDIPLAILKSILSA